MRRRLLLIGYWYPDTGMGGVRLRRIARWLPRFGWETVVLTHRIELDANQNLPPGVRLVEAASLDFARLYGSLMSLSGGPSGTDITNAKTPTAQKIGLTSKINRWFMVPDKQVAWYRAAVREGQKLLAAEKYDAILASQDPRTCLLVAARLSSISAVPCVLEYRDLWTGSPYYHLTQPTAFHRWLHERLERRALRQASRVTAVCRGIADYLAQSHGPILKQPVELNYNFFDPEEYPTAATAAKPKQTPFVVSYTGAFYGNRTPHQFFEGMRAFIDQAGLSSAEFRFRWAGAIVGIRDLDQVLDRAALRPYIDFLGQVAHREALAELARSHAALLIQAPDDTIHIPGKLFEALGARVPLLALANPCEVVDLIERCHAGIVCRHDPSAVAAGLTSLYQAAGRGPWTFNEAELNKFSARAAVGRFAALLELAATHQPATP
jgi:glycosyltransferase involved in cell wall biosynthesis